jgi:putative DNA primase/helicase
VADGQPSARGARGRPVVLASAAAAALRPGGARERQIEDLQGILAREHGPAVLSWIVQGAAEYAQHGLQEPASVKAATAAYESDQDTVTRFLDERCRLGGAPHVQVPVAVVRAAYEQWCREGGETPVSAKALTTALQRRAVGQARSSRTRRYVGITVLADESGDRFGQATFHQPAPPTLDGQV